MEETMIKVEEALPFEEPARRLTQRASDIYATLTFETDSLYNQPPPEPWVSMLIGSIFWLFALVLWAWRVRKITKRVGKVKLSKGYGWIRCLLTAYMDCDSALFVSVKMIAQSFIFLGGLQQNYRLAFAVMLGFFSFESFLESLRILLSYWEFDDIDSVVQSDVITSKVIRAELKKHPLTVLEPTNVYEDLSRGSVIVTMVFITQTILISFVVTDVWNTETHSCFDGTGGCPVTGTLGSYGLYILGIFMACVVLLGPKTNFGQSEQNPAYWMQLLLTCKSSKSKGTFYDPVKDKTRSKILRCNDWRIWARFWMSYLINGVGFHILVHALPIQVAGQGSLIGVVFRSVGMLYLVDMDDTPGYTMTLIPKDDDPNEKTDSGATATANNSEYEPATIDNGSGRVPSEVEMDVGEMATLAQKIIDDAQTKLNALSSGKVQNGFDFAPGQYENGGDSHPRTA